MSVVELVIALVIFVIGLIPTMTLFINMRKGLQGREDDVISTMLSYDLLETIRSKKWDENSTVPVTYVTARSPIQADAGETDVSLFDDVDDFDGYQDTVLEKFTRQVQVQYVDIDLDGAMTVASAPPTDFKHIRIETTYTGGPDEGEIIQTLLANHD